MERKNPTGFHRAARRHLRNGEQLEIVHKQLGGDVIIHWHDYVECELIFSGELEYIINGRTYHLTSGCAYIATPSDTHSMRIMTDEPVELFSISCDESYLDPELLARLADPSAEKVARWDKQEAAHIRSIMDLLEEDFTGMRSMRAEMLKSLVNAVLISFMRRMETDSMVVKVPDRLVMQVVAIISARFREKLTIKGIADTIYMTPNYIGERFKEEMGVSINTYLMETRLAYARNLLNTGKLDIKELAYQSGFNSTTYFSTSFKKRYGVSPTDYQKVLALKNGKQSEPTDTNVYPITASGGGSSHAHN